MDTCYCSKTRTKLSLCRVEADISKMITVLAFCPLTDSNRESFKNCNDSSNFRSKYSVTEFSSTHGTTFETVSITLSNTDAVNSSSGKNPLHRFRYNERPDSPDFTDLPDLTEIRKSLYNCFKLQY